MAAPPDSFRPPLRSRILRAVPLLSRWIDLIQAEAFSASDVWVVRPTSGPSELAELCSRFGADKAYYEPEGGVWPFPHEPHTYAQVYAWLFSGSRREVRNVLEVGVGRVYEGAPPGASLRAWKEYFPNALVFGADINEDVLFEDGRIRTAVMDQTRHESVVSFIEGTNVEAFDLIVDDGLHTFEANLALFEAAMPFLADGGYYVIEDCSMETVRRLEKYFQGSPHRSASVALISRSRKSLSENRLFVVRCG